MYYVYLLVNKQGQRYLGYTADLRRRIKEHNQQGKSWTQQRAPWKLVYYEAYLKEAQARAREKQLKANGSARAALYKRTEV